MFSIITNGAKRAVITLCGADIQAPNAGQSMRSSQAWQALVIAIFHPT
ncbi:hypothetical protein O9993_08900 [Vibrio lentus]|nr:hypothetical protein [Vibrio lentus]